MKKLLAWIAILAVLVVGGRWAWDHLWAAHARKVARSRVSVILHEHASNPQVSVSMWATGELMIEADLMQRYTDRYDAFRREAGLDEESGWSVESVELGANGETAFVTIAAGDARQELFVHPGRPIALAGEE